MAKQSFTSGQTLTAAQMNDLQTNDFNLTATTKTADATLVVGDRGTRVIGNAGTAITFTVPNSTFTAGDSVQVHNIGAGTVTVAAGTGLTLNSADVLTLGQYQSGTIYFTSASAALLFPTAKTAAAASSSGLVCVKAETSFSAVTSVTADNVFTSTYRNYLVQLQFVTSAENDVVMKFRASGTATSSGYNRQLATFEATTSFVSELASQSSYLIGHSNGTFYNQFNINLYAPQITQPTVINNFFTAPVANYTTIFIGQNGGVQTDSTAFDGIEWSVATGTFTGVYAIYGYSKTV